MQTIVDLKSQVVNQRAFALNYLHGFRYLDCMGKVINSILKDNDRWVFKQVDGVARLADPEANITMTFGVDRISLNQTLNRDVEQVIDGSQFGVLSESFSRQVIASIDPQQFTRIGYQINLLYPTADSLESSRLLAKLKLAPLMDARLGEITDRTIDFTVARPSHMLKIAISTFEQQISISPALLAAARLDTKKLDRDQKRAMESKVKAQRMIASRPKFGVMLVLDAFLEDPPLNSASAISDFVLLADQDSLSLRSVILEESR